MEERSSQLILSPALFAQALIPVLAGASISAILAPPQWEAQDWAGESMLRKASSNPAGINSARTRSRGERIRNACGLNLDAFPRFYLEASSPTYTSNSPSRT